ncbi:MAG: hypothetical protein ABFS30_09315, partial [Pseudomonadota bacterium]
YPIHQANESDYSDDRDHANSAAFAFSRGTLSDKGKPPGVNRRPQINGDRLLTRSDPVLIDSLGPAGSRGEGICCVIAMAMKSALHRNPQWMTMLKA